MEGGFVVALLFVFVVLGWRRWKRKAKQARYKRRKGHNPEEPWFVPSKEKMEERAHHERCVCGGPLLRRSRGDATGWPGVVMFGCECRICEEKVRLYFRIEYLQ